MFVKGEVGDVHYSWALQGHMHWMRLMSPPQVVISQDVRLLPNQHHDQPRRVITYRQLC